MKRAAWAVALVLALAGCKAFKRVGTLDEGRVYDERQLHEQTLSSLRARGLLRADEHVLAYYYRGVDDHTYLLTDQRLSYSLAGELVTVIALEDLASVKHAPMPVGKLTTARARDGRRIMFDISDINGGPRFRDALDAELRKRRGAPEATP